MKKLKPSIPWYDVIKCPICHANTFEYFSVSEFGFGLVEQHGYCDRCGFTIEQAYSPVYAGFCDVVRGFKKHNGEYVPKNTKRHRRVRRKLGIKNIDVNPAWLRYI